MLIWDIFLYFFLFCITFQKIITENELKSLEELLEKFQSKFNNEIYPFYNSITTDITKATKHDFYCMSTHQIEYFIFKLNESLKEPLDKYNECLDNISYPTTNDTNYTCEKTISVTNFDECVKLRLAKLQYKYKELYSNASIFINRKLNITNKTDTQTVSASNYLIQTTNNDSFYNIKRNDLIPFKLETSEKPFVYKKSSNSMDILLWNIDVGGISLGYCFGTDLIFTGIYINYFGDNCYHLDYIIEDKYNITGRTCLSQYELYSIKTQISNNNFVKIYIHTEKEPIFNYQVLNANSPASFCGACYNQITTIRFSNSTVNS